MTLLTRNFNVLLTLFLIVSSHRVATRESIPNEPGGNGNGNRSISLNTNNLNNLLNKNPLETVNNAVNSEGVVSSINAIKTDLDNLSQQFNIFKVVDIFVAQWRQSIPLMVTKSNFTLLQAALLCAVGSMTAGAAIIAAEAFYFKKVNEQEYYHKLYQQEHAHEPYGNLPSLTYGQHHKSSLERSDEDGAAVTHARDMASKPGPSTMSPQKLAEWYQQELKRMNKPQSLKRSQRRRQRKNKNSAQLANNLAVLANGGIKSKRSVRSVAPSRRKRQITADQSSEYRPNSFNQFLLNPKSRSDIPDTVNTSLPTPTPAFAGPRAPPEPLPLPPQQQLDETFPLAPPSPPSSKFDFIEMFKSAMTFLLNKIFDAIGGYPTKIGPGQLSRNDFQQQEQRPMFRYPKLNPNRNFIRQHGKFV